ncbi:MAG: 5'/3'-nucleotidase SurE, partial [Gammaproteobacteria bacterium]|nr:5'/3'-nucleotidase SurE [Gammaproteobacteria bacterium]
PKHFDTAAQVTRELVDRLIVVPLPADTILNVNVPDVPYGELNGIEATRLGARHRSEPVVTSKDPKGRTVYWVGPAGAGQDAGPGTDFHAIEHGSISVTPLQVDLTRHDRVAELRSWLAQ